MARKKDIGHEETEAVLSELEGRIYKEYAQAETELSEKLEDYMSRFEKKDALKQQALANGQITQKEYDDWYTGQVAMGKRWESMRDTISEDLTTAAQKAQSITYGYMPEVYAINHNYGTYQVESLFNIDTKYTAYNAQTVERLFDDDDKLYHDYGITVGQHINEGKMQEWNKRQVQSVMTQSILQGESIGAIATRMQKELGDSVLLEDIKDQNKKTAEEIADELVRRNRNAAIRNARTITTGVENAARIDSYKRAEDMGIRLEQEWLATLDGRTRHEHRELDGQRVKVGEKFKVAGYEIAFPADPTAEAFLVYNCRCTLVPALEGHGKSASDVSSRHTDNMEEETYEEWKESHNIHSDSITKQDDIAETMKRKYGRMYSSYASGATSGGKSSKKYTSSSGTTKKKKSSSKKSKKDKIATISIPEVKDYYGDIQTDVYLSKERKKHIKDHHPDDYKKYKNNIKSTIEAPDVVINDEKNENTAQFIKKIDGSGMNVVVKLANTSDEDDRSFVVTMHAIGEKRLNSMKRNKKIIYEAEE